jgi:hypothetical protein
LLGICFAILLAACGDQGDSNGDEAENNGNDANEASSELETDTQVENEAEEVSSGEVTFTEAASISFEEVGDDNAVRFVLEDLDTPFDVEDGTYHIYYGDNAFVTAFITRGAFAYDVSEDEVIWDIEGILGDYAVHDERLYIAGNNRDPNHMHIEALSFSDGEIMETYEHEEMSGIGDLQVLDDYILFTTTYIDDPDSYLFFEVMDKDTHDTVEIPVIGGDERSKVELDDGVLLTNARESDEPDSSPDSDHFVNIDKETGERLYTVEANAVRDTPVRNEDTVYYFDHLGNQIKAFSLDGEFLAEVSTSHPDSGMIIPVATEASLIVKDKEGLSWFEADLSEEKHRVDFGDEHSQVYEMQATSDRLYAVYGEGEASSDSKDFYVVELDVETGEIYEKVDLGLHYDANPVVTNYVHNDKVYFSLYDETNDERVDYIFSNGDVNEPF